ncbi:flagellar motor stator protein MotA [Candidatus Hepatobacter penaei]|uniref:flagellar motor stator protein MotA n=1 Tax=Candidatus Hepatobacter penaei TaxID=1274402 RepID=UPI0004F28BA8|nr:flagellar motor stator protein MotA [Candidatus Hepatobacter penaei]TGW15394.1 flagellar motor stator protein MotA [bacterium NHP-B]
MLWMIGILIVAGCVLGGYAISGGHIHGLWQPAELLIIFGSAAGALVTSCTMGNLKEIPGALGRLFKGPKYSKASYTELLTVLFTVFKTIRTKGILEIEKHIENPKDSPIFSGFSEFVKDDHALTFLCDYLRMLTMGTESPTEVEAVLDEELETLHEQTMHIPGVFQNIADGLPALGIVAAVLGVIHTMGAISQPPEIIGNLIATALVGTFAGILLSYGFVGPIGAGIKAIGQTDLKYFEAIKSGILAHMHGYPPSVSVEFARKTIYHENRPTFYEVEQAVDGVSV